MASSEDAKARAAEASRRYRARRRGEKVAKLKKGRPPKGESSGWESWLRQENRAAFLGVDDFFSRWQLQDPATREGRMLNLPVGSETHDALVRFMDAQMTVGAIKGQTAELVGLYRKASAAVADAPDGAPDDEKFKLFIRKSMLAVIANFLEELEAEKTR